MIDLALDPSDTRPARAPDARPARGRALRRGLFGLVAAGALGGFAMAASALMAGLAAPPPVRIAPMSRAADWPDLKDGLPVLAGTSPAPAAPMRAEPDAPAPRMAALPDPIAAMPAPAKGLPAAASPTAPAAAKAAVTPEPPTKRIPTPTLVAPIGPTRQAMPLAPARTAALQPPRASETVRARDLAEPVATPAAVAPAPATPAASAGEADKPARKAVAARRAPAATRTTAKAGSAAAPAAVAQADAPDSEETEVLGIKIPSLAPAGRKLKEGVDALGDAVKNVF